MTNPLQKKLAFYHKYLQSYDRFANLFQLPSQITLIGKFDVKVSHKKLQKKLNYQMLKVGIPLEILAGLP